MKNNIDKMPNRVLVEGLATSYPAGTHIERHVHDTHQVAHTIAGVLRVSARDAAWIVPTGRALWIPAGVEHEIRCAGQVEMRTVYIQGNSLSYSDKLSVISVSPLLREVLVRFGEGMRESQVPALTALLLDELAAMRVQSLSLPIPENAKLARLTNEFLEHPSDGRSLEDWAKLLGYSPRNLIRHIRLETGLSFRELRRQARVLVAIERLANGEPITTIALDVGFSSPSAFTYAFRSVTGVAPRDYFK